MANEDVRKRHGTMDESTYYRDHWVRVEPERAAAYEEMFRWRPQMEPLIAPAALEPGLVVVDYGCGPGGLAIELARRVGERGHVHAVDINTVFVEQTRMAAVSEGIADRVTVHHIDADRVPLADQSADRVLCKNVLEYVDDVTATLREFRRVLRPGGLAHVTDSDWGMLVVEPLGPERVEEMFAAARMAYRTPLIGRKLFGCMKNAGFRDVRVQVLATSDTQGLLAPIVWNMANYARESERLQVAHIDAFLADLQRAIADGTYLLVLPQFLVTGAA
jgi:ubiquinone/menaquinone biosynthesis C-methylase UbiE